MGRSANRTYTPASSRLDRKATERVSGSTLATTRGTCKDHNRVLAFAPTSLPLSRAPLSWHFCLARPSDGVGYSRPERLPEPNFCCTYLTPAGAMAADMSRHRPAFELRVPSILTGAETIKCFVHEVGTETELCRCRVLIGDLETRADANSCLLTH